MKTDEFIEAALNYKSAEKAFVDEELCGKLDLSKNNIKNVKFRAISNDTSVSYKIVVELTGTNHLKSENLAKVKGVTIVTPKWLEIDCGEIDL